MRRMQFHEEVLIIDLPNPCIQFQEEIIIPEITQEHTPRSITDKILIVTKLNINITGYIKRYMSSCIEIIYTSCCFEWLIKTRTRYRFSFSYKLLNIQWGSFLVICEVG